jgi:nitroreductase
MIETLLARSSVPASSLREPGPDDAELEKILTAGLRVPDHGNVEPWRVQVLRKDAQQKLGELYAELFQKDNPDAPNQQVEFQRKKASRAPLMLVVTCYPDPERFEKVPLVEQQLSTGAVCLNLLHAANSLGYGAQWLTGWPAYHPDVRRFLGHDPDTLIAGFIFVGSRPDRAPPERERPHLGKVTSEWRG